MKNNNQWNYFIRKISFALYAFYLTNKHGASLKKTITIQEKTEGRYLYCQQMAKVLGLTVKTTGFENIDKNKQYVIAINHRSILDPVISDIALNKSLPGFWIAKRELSKSPFYKSFVNNAGTILVDREDVSPTKFFGTIKDKVKNEKSNIFIFPEGSRNKTSNTLAEFKPGVNVIAMKNKLEILPIYIETPTNEVVNNAFLGKKQIIEVRIGKPFSSKTRDIQAEFKKTFGIE